MSKSIFRSKTLAVNTLIILLSALQGSYVDKIRETVSAHPSATLAIIGVIQIVLRLVTRQAVSLFPEEETPKSGKGPFWLAMLAASGVALAACASGGAATSGALREMRPVPVPPENHVLSSYNAAAESDLVRALERMEVVK